MRDLAAHRTQQEPGEPATAPGTHDQQAGVTGGPDKFFGRIPGNDGHDDLGRRPAEFGTIPSTNSFLRSALAKRARTKGDCLLMRSWKSLTVITVSSILATNAPFASRSSAPRKWCGRNTRRD